jgi:NADP-reducing hydrogenase subunit HndB
MARRDFLKRVDVFQGLSEAQLETIEEGCTEKQYIKGGRLFGEGDEAKWLWILVEGRVSLSFDLPGRETTIKNTISTILPKGAFGWSSFVPPYKCRLSAYCLSNTCKVVWLETEFLLRLFQSDPVMGYVFMRNLVSVVSTRFHQLQESGGEAPVALAKITVHMATCGIAAGAREVFTALMDEISQAERDDIEVRTAGCIGKCATEPNVTVEVEGEEQVVYQKMNPARMREVFAKHILFGEVQKDYVLLDS